MPSILFLHTAVVTATLLCGTLGLPNRLSAQATATRTAPGVLWRGLEEVERTAFMRGYVDGAVMTHALVMNYVRDSETRAAYLRPGTEQSFESALSDVVDEISATSPAQIEPVIRLMTQLYSDPANSCIYLAAMAFAAISRLRGLGDDEFAQYLARLRAGSARNC